ncbi:xylose isomerase-like TIM barrel protein [Tetragenococcus muriaticus PMC-11-5]|uniref:Xylose isomerase-like TIM barrel protein n=1 Tax=Tetragenococcus muriaticus PMC-11-5 TaxID=1302649 RepID=A0A091C8Q5_9ENTE|nr:xylose isomerase-like TIM barrel protein [Tetragenococcus muriaticus PMC-11-5]
MSTEIPLTISSLTLGANCSFEERISAAANAGYEGVGLTAEAYADALATGLTDEDFLQLLEKYQIKVTEVECIQAWAAEERSYEENLKSKSVFICVIYLA